MSESNLLITHPNVVDGFWDFEKNLLTPDSFTYGSNKKVFWKCSFNHSWNRSVKNQILINSCPECKKETSKEKLFHTNLKNNGTLEEVRPDIAKDYSRKNILKASEVTWKSAKKVLWECSDCSFEWTSPVSYRTIKDFSHCAVCAHRVLGLGFNDVKTLAPNLIKESKSKDISDLIFNSNVLVEWTCSNCSTLWNSSIRSRTVSLESCPYCRVKNNDSINFKEIVRGTSFFNKICTYHTLEEVNTCGIYMIRTRTGKVYVGSTITSFKERWSNHYYTLNADRKKHHCLGLQKSVDKYGSDSLTFIILETVEKKEGFEDRIASLEVKHWESMKSSGIKLLNGRPTGMGSVFHTDETKLRISESLCKFLSVEEEELVRHEFLKGFSPNVIARDHSLSKKRVWDFVKNEDLYSLRESV